MCIRDSVNAGHDGNGTEQMPFRHINDAAKIAQPGDEVWVAPGVYREDVYKRQVHCIIYKRSKQWTYFLSENDTMICFISHNKLSDGIMG